MVSQMCAEEACSKEESGFQSCEAMYIVGQGVTYLLMASLPTTQMATLWAARRLSSVHQIQLLRPRFPDRKVGTAGCSEIGDVPSVHLLDLE